MHRFQALAACLVSILLWASLALLGSKLVHVPPLLLTGSAFLVGSLPSLLFSRRQMFPRPGLLAFGVAGLFGYHLLLFLALRLSPPVEANLINYLWPILIVLLSPVFLKGYQIRAHHVIGGIISFVGVGLIVSGGGELSFRAQDGVGYACALAAALTWSSYSVLSKRLPNFPTAAIGGFCFVSGLLSIALHVLLEPRVSLSLATYGLLCVLGVGPMGIAFYTWDFALKKGDPRIIGALSYLTPLLSTTLLVFVGGKAMSSSATLAMVLIVFGALLGSKDLLKGHT